MVERPLAGCEGQLQNQFSLRVDRAMRDILKQYGPSCVACP